MDQSAIQSILQLAIKPIIDTPNGKLLFNYTDAGYQFFTSEESRTVSNLESFQDYLKFIKQSVTNSKTTVVFNLEGAIARIDDTICFYKEKPNNDKLIYKRVLSPLWAALSNLINRELSHKELLRAIQRLRSGFASSNEYTALLMAYRGVVFDANTVVMSQPAISKGKTGRSINFQLSRKGAGDIEIELPPTFELTIPFTRGSDVQYTAEIEIDSDLNDPSDPSKGIYFSLAWPSKESVTDQAIETEVASFREWASENIPDLLAVVSY